MSSLAFDNKSSNRGINEREKLVTPGMLLSLSFGNLSHTSIRYDLAFYVNYHHYYFPFYFICGGQEISILLDSAEFIPLSENGEENQVNIFVNYTVNDPALVSQRINSVMKVYSTNGTFD